MSRMLKGGREGWSSRQNQQPAAQAIDVEVPLGHDAEYDGPTIAVRFGLASRPSRKDKDAARLGCSGEGRDPELPVEVRAFPGLKIETWGTHFLVGTSNGEPVTRIPND